MAYTNLCRAYNDLKRPELAVTACNNALKLNPEDGETMFYLARAYDFAGRRGDATLYYKKAVVGLEKFTSQTPDYSDGFYLLGNAYFADNQREKAVEAYQKCLSLSPRFARARYNIGIIQVLQKNKTAAMEQYTSLLTIDQSLAGKLKAEIDKL
jgi:superkiller protein 3